MANESIRAAFERMWQHTTTALSNKASGVLNQAKEYTDSQRIGYTEIIRDTVLLPHTTITVESREWYKEGTLGMVAGESYLVELDDVEYICECTGINATENYPDLLLLGNISLIFDEFPSNNYPFVFGEDLMNGMIILGYGSESDNGTHTLSVWHINASVHQIDPKYIPSTTPNVQTAQVGQTVVVKAVDEHGVPTEWEAVDNPDILSEVTETLTFDGDLTGKIVRDYSDMEFVKVSDIPLDPYQIVSVTTRLTNFNNLDTSGTADRSSLSVEKTEPGVYIIGVDDSVGALVLVLTQSILVGLPEDELEKIPEEEVKALVGTYVRYIVQDINRLYTKQIEYAVDKIDPKYLPEGGVGYTEPSKTLCTIDVVDGDGEINKRIFLEPGTSYTVTFNGEKYTSVAAYFDATATFIGNASLLGIGADTGEPFLCGELCEDGEWFTFITYPGYSCKATISTTGTIRKIDPKFLHDMCLPVVIDLDTYGDTPISTILTTLLGAGGGQATATGIDRLFADLDTDSPIIMKFTLNGAAVFVHNVSVVKLPDDGVVDFSFDCATYMGENFMRVSVHVVDDGTIYEAVETIPFPG